MERDSDVARVAAALKSPGLRYRSFGNEPVRGTPSQSVDTAPNSFPLVGAAMEAAAAEAKPAPPAAEPHASVPPPSFVPLPADFASRSSPGPVDLSYKLPEPARPAAPTPVAEAPYRPQPPLPEPPAAPFLAPPPAPAPSHASSGTLATLLHGMAQTVAPPGWPAAMPQTGLLPAGMVTLPLAEVMRLVGGAQLELASPFAAFRIAGNPPGVR